MERTNGVIALARRAAALLPEPPAPGDAFGHLAWEELVLDTAARLAVIGACEQADLPVGVSSSAEVGRVVTWQSLLRLAAQLGAQGPSEPAGLNRPAHERSARVRTKCLHRRRRDEEPSAKRCRARNSYI